ncbi:Bacterial flagellin C-terminus domain protein [Verrucomicrobiia bacterium DG1235]|nr:Bacterial flagellin C-terminus domain protein [Verrucomicrobiae bacterium DG1235]
MTSGMSATGPSEDAGGLAVSMKMDAAIRRQASASASIGNTLSYLQTQDGAMNTASEILSRIGELKTLSQDVTKNTTDKANYNTEFLQLKEQLSGLTSETFNGLSLFGSESLTVKTSGNPDGGTIQLSGVDLLGSGPLFEDDFSGSSLSSDWTVNSGSPAVNSGVLTLDGSRITLAEAFDEDVSVEVQVRFDNSSDQLDIYNDSNYYLSGYIDGNELPDTDWHTLTFDLATDGTMANLELDGSDFSSATGTVSTASGDISFGLSESGSGDGVEFRNLSVSPQSGVSSSSSVGSVASTADLDSVDIETVKDAIGEVATFRAQNGAQQSRLNFAQEQLNTNRVNLEAAKSRIMDVDVAAESTNLARLNILQQAGASMLQQANQSQQIALKLIG